MDVEMQMGANGLPVKFSSTSDQPQESHVAGNLAATISNSEASVNPLPPEPEENVWLEAVPETVPQPVPEPVVEAAPEAPVDAVTNGIADHVKEPAGQSISAVPDSQPQSTLDTTPTAPPAATSISESNLTESFVPSSIPAEIPSSASPVETSQFAMDISEPQPVPSLPPTSDLRTSPHADALTPEAAAEVEARKHQLDNSADVSVTLAKPEITETSFSTIPPPVESAPATQAPVTNIGLPSPPAQSPPPAPQLAHVTLPEEKPTRQSMEPPTEPATIPPPVEEPKVPAQAEAEDQVMTDIAAQPVKQAREREDDTVEMEPAPKRVKTDEPQPRAEEPEFKVPDVPASSAPSQMPNGDTAAAMNGADDGDDSVTPARLAHMKRVISNLKKSNASAAFRLPVDYVALNIPSYPDVIKHPMDLGTIDQRLKQNKYTSLAAFVSDFQLIVNNCFTFNGPDHAVSQAAKKMKSSFDGQMKNLPKASVEEPSKETKKAAKKQEPTRSAPPRRPSVTTSTAPGGTAGSPKSAVPPTPSFAPGPDGIPLIRRDSSLADGRPKRAIVPTKRNQEFGGGRPKKKKYELQLKFCNEVLKELTSPKYWQINQYFTHPVDPVALNIPTYFQIIKKPMDLGTVKQKLDNNVYEKAKDFEEDVRLIFKNCYKFNPDGDLVNTSGHQLEEMFNKKWATKDEWIGAREPQSEPQSGVEDEEEEEDESEEEAEDDSDQERNDKIKRLQQQIEEMSKQMGELAQKKNKKSKSPPTKKSKSKSSKKDKPAANFPNLGKDKKEKKKPAPRSRPEKDRYVTFAEKQYISNGIAMLPEKQMQEALKIIQNSVPSLANSDQNEIELDIEEVPNHALLKLLNFVKKYAGPPPDESKAEPAEVYNPAPVQKTKKGKPMSKHEQEAQIEELKGKLGAYAGPISPNAVPSIETGESSDDDGDSEESEEE
ncbi:uncharacterized protein Z518_06179 [Rhinocladiella mackenziei CBS 650.93]|uniref:Bromodomain-containing protein n=1 Tax=Rhinocladiella mackenziei CBS 650.93 TaxID=1442369 RepID=A0A0D2FT73_9EURO|nr:uncharacterized protein Z518_06179 [Rhinocladiella mackenziei CBS 650.93]KIX05307.1 hypothetical protein Z518_06179 [Rhinocladiella mackenziei CBS 650.93]